MKPSSMVFTQPQRPQTILGFPPLLIALSTAAAASVYVLCNLFQHQALSMILAVSVFLTGTFLSWRACRHDIHVETVMVLVPTFWRTFKNNRLWKAQTTKRCLLAGLSDGTEFPPHGGGK